MSTFKKMLALVLALTMVFCLAACGNTNKPGDDKDQPTPDNPTPVDPTPVDPTPAPADTTLVYATATFGQKFSPFFSTTAYDTEVYEMFTGGLLAADRGGAIIMNGIEGETVTYNGTDYTYYGMGNVEVVQNDDGSVDYFLTMRDDIKFSDGTPATIDDVIFGIYVYCDPTYDGSSTIYALPIEGMDEYYHSQSYKDALILAAGRDGTSDLFTADEAATYWAAWDAAGAKFAQEIVDYVKSAGYNAETDSVAACAANWGFELDESATVADFFNAIAEKYGYIIADMESETAGSSLQDLINAELGDKAESYKALLNTSNVDYIKGIIRTGDYTMTVHMTEYDATAIYNMGFTIAPLHHYGDKSQYDYENHKFGFPKGDLSIVKSKTTDPLGCGPYIYQGYANGVVTLKANPTYFLGAPKIETILMQESVDSDYVPGIVTGTFDLAQPSISADTVAALKDANSNNELTGDTLTTYLVDYRGYGYLGINADLVNIDGQPASDASKALRKGFMTLFAVYRDTVINSYYGDRAAVIQYPISNTSWAAPQPADEGYKAAYSTDVDGNPIYDSSMNDEQKYAAAKTAAIGYFKAAGFTYDEAAGKFTDATQTWEVMIPGAGQQDHPAYGVATAASEVLLSLGITLQVNDVGTAVWNNALESNTAMMWAAVWQSTVDPDMTQVYHSNNAHGKGTNSNHYQVDDAELDALIVAGRKSADTEERKSIYRDAMDIIMDWGCELPLYQRKDCTVVSTIRVDNDTMPKDMTPYWGWKAEIETLAVK